MGGGSGGGSSGAGWTLMLLPAVDGEILAEYWTDTNVFDLLESSVQNF